ncbi:MAG TPA: peptide chain release factor 1 [Candidatus Limnocylindria bacterium]|nr:peptide chain release factor 1 [Candidatus Limnocylindria bacterium]
MIIAWDELQKRHDEIVGHLASPTVDSGKRHELQKELARLTQLLAKHTSITALERQIKESQDQQGSGTDPEMAALFAEEVVTLQGKLTQATQELDDFMFPPSELDDRSVFLEIRAGAGGKEASLFAADLMTMYTNYGLKKGWKVSVESSSSTDLGGLREVVLYIKGKQVYGSLKQESGVHRVQRVPETETSGRIHTSTATVAVLPEADEVDVTINPSDLRIDVYRSGGAGGQHVNTTDSAVRITHIPTGAVVACQDERSQHKNKAKAMKMLQSRILAAQLEKQAEELSKARKAQVGTGMRAEKVRTYNFPQNRVTDHQVEVTLNKLDMFIEGDMDDIIQALREKDRLERRALMAPVVGKK